MALSKTATCFRAVIIFLLITSISLMSLFIQESDATSHWSPVNLGTTQENVKQVEKVISSGYTGNTRDNESIGPPIEIKKVKISAELAGELGIEGEFEGTVNIKKICKWKEREWEEKKEIWSEGMYRTKWVASYLGYQVDFMVPDDTWQKMISGSKTVVTESKWYQVPGSEKCTWVSGEDADPIPITNLSIDSTLSVDFSFVDNVLGFISHEIFIDGVSIPDGTDIDVGTLGLGDHLMTISFDTYAGTTDAVMPISVVNPIQLVQDQDTLSLGFDETKEHEFTVKNNLEHSIHLKIHVSSLPDGWLAGLDTSSLTLAANESAQVDLYLSSEFNTEISTTDIEIIAEMVDGTYSDSIILKAEAKPLEDFSTLLVDYQGKEYSISYTNVTPESKLQSLTFDNINNSLSFEVLNNDSLFVFIMPKELIKEDSSFSGPNVEFYEDSTFSETSSLFIVSSDQGTAIIPEFGTIAALILAVAVTSIIAVSAKSRLSIMPRY